MRKRIAVIFGGHSSEYEVSLQSAFSVLQNINENKFEVFPVGITREGEWYHYTGGLEQIRDNSWAEEKENLHSVAVSQSRPAPGFLVFDGDGCRRIPVDRFCMAETVKTAPYRVCLNWRGFRLPAAAHSRRRSAWIRTGHINWLALQA